MENKEKLTLAERFAITKNLKSADREYSGEVKGVLNCTKEIWRSMELSQYLEEAKHVGFYGKRATDLLPEDRATVDTKLSNKIVRTERQMKRGDNEAEGLLRTLKAEGKYGKRCTDINLDA